MTEDKTLELSVEGHVWAEVAMEGLSFFPEVDVPFPYKLSHFVGVTYRLGRWWLSSPLTHVSIQVHEGLLLKLIQDLDHDPASVDDVLARLVGVMLANAGLLNTRDDSYKAWPAVDLTYLNADHPFLRPHIALPPLKPPMSDDIVVLPDIPMDQWQDRPLVQVVSERRTVYEYGETPITIEQLSEFLLRTLKVHAYLNGQDYDSTVRSYASAGAAYELEAYLLSEQCEGLASGFYHYHPGQHALEHLSLSNQDREDWITAAKRATNRQVKSIQLLFFFTARIGRIHWKIRPLSLSYTNLGVVFQSLYLTATAMTLAPCALGGWNARWFAEATGIPLDEEALVGQFLLGAG